MCLQSGRNRLYFQPEGIGEREVAVQQLTFHRLPYMCHTAVTSLWLSAA